MLCCNVHIYPGGVPCSRFRKKERFSLYIKRKTCRWENCRQGAHFINLKRQWVSSNWLSCVLHLPFRVPVEKLLAGETEVSVSLNSDCCWFFSCAFEECARENSNDRYVCFKCLWNACQQKKLRQLCWSYKQWLLVMFSSACGESASKRSWGGCALTWNNGYCWCFQAPEERVPAKEVEAAVKAWHTSKEDFPTPLPRQHPM